MSGLFVFLQNLLLKPYIIDMERFKIFILVLSIVSLSVFLDGCDKDEPLDEVIIPPLEEINPDNEKPDPEKPDPDPEPEKPDPDPEPEKPDPDPEPEIPQEWAGKVVWTHGLTGMPDPQMWEYAYLTPSKVRGLKWNKAYGWFDCNKKDVWGEQPNSDNNLCWAASVSNIIYWWLEQNKEYVNRFGYDGPSRYNGSLDCEVFDFYKKNFSNTGNNVAAALNWFFTGKFLNGAKQEAGFFKEVLGENCSVCETCQSFRYRFTEIIKEALSGQKAIGCAHSFGRQTHAINIWGAEFDSQGEITYLYITDNNDTDLENNLDNGTLTKAGMIRKPIQIRDGIPFMESSVPGCFTIRILELNFMGLKKAEWKKYFQNFFC
jgi:hypothetical protein